MSCAVAPDGRPNGPIPSNVNVAYTAVGLLIRNAVAIGAKPVDGVAVTRNCESVPETDTETFAVAVSRASVVTVAVYVFTRAVAGISTAIAPVASTAAARSFTRTPEYCGATMCPRTSTVSDAMNAFAVGLSIVIELAALYGGGLTLGCAPLGGLRAELVLPAG